jgi:5'-methylthioadenosine phosphorylase
MPEPVALAVIGGSGLYALAAPEEELHVETPYGPPSDAIQLVRAGGRRIAFLPRHGKGHTLPPHRVPYRANLFALRSVGVERVIGPCAVGSLRPGLEPGWVVICDQLVDRTWGRDSTFFEGPEVVHLAAADPYCTELRPLAAQAAREAGFPVADSGTVVVTQGPRFSTRAESVGFQRMGWDAVGMTQHPEVVLARELGMCYVTIAVVTDFDAGLSGRADIQPVTQEAVMASFAQSRERLSRALELLVARIPEARSCACAQVPRPVGG